MAGGPAQPQISEGMKILFYILSFLFWLIGIIIGAIYYSKPDPESKHVGKMCIILAVVGVVFWVVCGLAIWGATLLAF
jgi:membrane protein YdbS with pleckstrin-like domain